MASTRNLARNREMYRLWIQGMPQHEIGAKFGILQSAVAIALKDFRENHISEQMKEDLRQELDAWYRDTLWDMQKIAELGPIPAYSNGRPIVTGQDENGDDVYADDWSGAIKARELQLKVQDARRKMLGLDDATKIENSGEIRHTIVGVPIEDV